MPTGYTACIEDGTVTDFKTFATRCLRAMGCCIMQRDDDMSDLPKHREPTDYHPKALAEAREKLAALRAMTKAEIRAAMEAENARFALRNKEWKADKETEVARYDAMTEQVKAWTPPTPGHENFKAFMLYQLRISCLSREPYQQPMATDPKAWHAERIERAERDIAYHTEKHAEELKRCEESNAFMDAALASFDTVKS